MELAEITLNVPFFEDHDKKERLVYVIGLLMTRSISLAKASEVLDIKRDTLFEILDMMNIDFSFLTKEDITHETSL